MNGRNWKRDMYLSELAHLEEKGELVRRGGIRIHSKVTDGVIREALNGKRHRGVHLRMWRGKRAIPFYDYLVREDKVEEVIAKAVVSEIEHSDSKDLAKKKRKEDIDRMAETIDVGTILYYSWGYDQTNPEYWEVVEKPSPKTVILRKLCTETVEGSEVSHGMACEVRPIPGEYVSTTGGPNADGEMFEKDPKWCGPLKKRIGPYGVKFAHGTASPVDASHTAYDSWYA